MRQLTKNTTIEDVIFDLRNENQNELADWLEEKYNAIVSNVESKCQHSYETGYEIGCEEGYDDGYGEGYDEAIAELDINSYEKGYNQGLIDAKKQNGIHSISR